MKKILNSLLAVYFFFLCSFVFADNSKPATLPRGEIIEINSIDQVVPGYPTVVLYGFKSCPYCVVEQRLLQSKIDRLRGRIHIYHVDIYQRPAFSGSINPCGGGSYPQTQFFDTEAKQIACYNGFNKAGIIRTMWELTKINLEL